PLHFDLTGVWTLAVILALPPLTKGWGDYGFLPNQSFCFCRWRSSISYTFFMVGVCFGGPCSVMTFCYINILKVVRQSRKRVASNPMPTIQQRPKTKGSPKTEPKKSVPSFCVNGNTDTRSPSKGSVNPTVDAVNGGDARQMLRTQLNDLLRSNTVGMSQNSLSQKNLSQSDHSDSDDSRPGSVEQNRSQSADSTPLKTTSLRSLRPKPREIKWIVPERKLSLASIIGSTSPPKDGEDNNSNKLNGSPKVQEATERSSLARLAVPVSTDVARRKQRKKNRSESEKRRKVEELKLTKSFLVVIFVFVLCWFPFCITMFWSVFSKIDNAVPRPVDMGTLLLGYLNSCCNPIIYGVMNKRFRAGYKSVLCGWRRRTTDSNNTTFQVDGINLNTSTVGSTG
ncbi:alpha-2B adrenergic receptor, partial [Strongylocentrotus purpuratus]|uniref:G-protein coupled receptors family 1 profile domain-containing protein n=1 Tax=Strongylocentrotus purpuratus TaxID=7668 RepID=A0A7M7GHB3_STRPU